MNPQNVSVIEELSILCRWEEKGVAVESFLEIITLKRTNAETKYTTSTFCLKSKGLQVSNIICMYSMVLQHSQVRRLESMPDSKNMLHTQALSIATAIRLNVCESCKRYLQCTDA